jgi:hypothetical protein
VLVDRGVDDQGVPGVREIDDECGDGHSSSYVLDRGRAVTARGGVERPAVELVGLVGDHGGNDGWGHDGDRRVVRPWLVQVAGEERQRQALAEQHDHTDEQDPSREEAGRRRTLIARDGEPLQHRLPPPARRRTAAWSPHSVAGPAP